ncbi:MAG: hypothetical protein EA370_15100 [Wenzhouxiangella sp.]|nr:MAG: hypothetical protein EA370_15100 [Wenzhouxiangella sp.]
MSKVSSAKEAFLEELDRKVEQSEDKASRFSTNQRAMAMAQYMRALREEVSDYPDDHALFQNWQRQRWAPVTVSDSQQFIRVA